jgi:hypothetical protein
MKKSLIGILIVLATFLISLSITGQEKKPSMRKEIVRLYYIQPMSIWRVLEPFKSQDGKVIIASTTSPGTIVLNDYPENVDIMLKIIKDMDVRIPDMLFTVQLILGTESAGENTDEALINDPAIKELRSFLKFKTYSLLDTSIVRAQNMESSRTTLGPKGEFVLWLKPHYSKKENTEWIQLELHLEQKQGIRTQKETQQEGGKTVTTEQDRPFSDTVLESNLTIKAGDKTVVGVSRTLGGDRGLILIISGKVLD